MDTNLSEGPSDETARFTEKVKAAQIELERATQSLYGNVNSDTYNSQYTHAVLKLDKTEVELEAALSKCRLKKF